MTSNYIPPAVPVIKLKNQNIFMLNRTIPGSTMSHLGTTHYLARNADIIPVYSGLLIYLMLTVRAERRHDLFRTLYNVKQGTCGVITKHHVL